MTDTPWLTAAAQNLVTCIVRSHQEAFGTPLLASPAERDQQSNQQLLAQELFATDTVVLAHDSTPHDAGEGPRLIYANRAALRLWGRDWAAMVGMPSSLTAEPSQRRRRQQALSRAQPGQAVKDYSGIRVDCVGRRFAIAGARIWSLQDSDGSPCGQAAAFSDWHWL